MVDESNICIFFDLIELEILPNNWVEQIIKVANENSYLVKLDGKSSTSREPENTEGAEVFVVEGDVIYEKLNWLYSIYTTELLYLANDYFQNQYEISSDLRNGTNINYLTGENARYEWHVDSNPLTGILFVTTHCEADGGELIFQMRDKLITIYPQSGTFILFDAREIPHTVKPLKKNCTRISVPMNYYIKGDEQTRPPDLDTYIYIK